jgi:hypothetical protein
MLSLPQAGRDLKAEGMLQSPAGAGRAAGVVKMLSAA